MTTRDEVLDIIQLLEKRRLSVLSEQENMRALIARNFTLLRDVEATLAEARQTLLELK